MGLATVPASAKLADILEVGLSTGTWVQYSFTGQIKPRIQECIL